MAARASSARPTSSNRRASVNHGGAAAGGRWAWARAGAESASRRARALLLFIDPPPYRSSTPHPIPPHVGGGNAAARIAPPLLLRPIGQPVLAQVVREVPGVDPEQEGRFFAHAPAPPLGLQQHLLLQAEEGRAQVQLTLGGRRVPGREGGRRGEEVQVVEA